MCFFHTLVINAIVTMLMGGGDRGLTCKLILINKKKVEQAPPASGRRRARRVRKSERKRAKARAKRKTRSGVSPSQDIFIAVAAPVVQVPKAVMIAILV